MTAIKGKKRVETGNTHFALRPRIPRVFFCVSPLFRRCSVYLFRPRYSNYRIHVQQSSLKKKLFFLFFFISQKRNKYVCCLRTHDLIQYTSFYQNAKKKKRKLNDYRQSFHSHTFLYTDRMHMFWIPNNMKTN